MSEKSQEAEIAPFTQAKDDEKAIYEIGFHIVPTVAETDVPAVITRIHAELAKAEAQIISEDAPKKVHFAYRIERAAAGRREKYTEGYFGAIKFETRRDAVKAIEDAIRADTDILRYLFIHTSREQTAVAPRAVFTSDRLEGETIHKPVAPVEEAAAPVSEEDLDKSIDALVS